MRVLVCGGRDFVDREHLALALNRMHADRRFTVVIHRGARGADSLAGEWAAAHGIDVVVEQARWKEEGRAAGPLRNQRMLELHRPDFVIAFPGGRGTADMKRRASAAGLIVHEL